MEKDIRLQKYLAMANVASRRASEQLILDARVSVNGEIVTELGTKVSETDEIKVDGVTVHLAKKKYYIMLNKPVGYVTTAKDQFLRPTVFDLVKDIDDRLFSVGRLDYDTEGLLILTNDGDFTQKISHPSHQTEKTYHAVISGSLSREDINNLKSGIRIEKGVVTAPAKVKVLESEKNASLVEIIIHEGRNRQVRRMFEAVGHRVLELKRVAIANVVIGNLPLGKWRHLREAEINNLLKGKKTTISKK